MKATFLSLVLLCFVAAACAHQATPPPADTTKAAAPAAAPASPSEPGAQTVTGTVLETMDGGGYTYLRVKTASGEIWAATGQTRLAVGDRVTVPLQMAMKDFHSPTLKRDFPTIYFVTHVAREGDTAAAPGTPAAAVMAAHASSGSTPEGATAPQAAGATAPIAVAPAPGGMTVADVWAKRASLGGKTVTVRGKVVKFNPGILDRNWIHIQDGTGNAADGSNDLTVTSQAETKVGDVVTVTGKVALNKDFTAGYVYPVMLENATIK